MIPADHSESPRRRNSTPFRNCAGATGSVFQEKMNRPSPPQDTILG